MEQRMMTRLGARPDGLTVQALIDRLLSMAPEIRSTYIVEVGGQYGMGDLTDAGISVNTRFGTVCLDNDPV